MPSLISQVQEQLFARTISESSIPCLRPALTLLQTPGHVSIKEKIDEIHLALESVLNAEGKCYLMMNVSRSALDDIRTIIPGMGGPTIMDVASSADMVAVHAVVDEEMVYQLHKPAQTSRGKGHSCDEH